MLVRSNRLFQLAALTVVTVAAYYARTSVGPLQETMSGALALSDNQMALLQGPPLAIGVLLVLPLGPLLDRGSRARLMLLFAALGLIASLVTAAASNFVLLFIARCGVGVSAAAMWTAALALVADWYPPEQRGRALTIISIGAVGGMSAAFALGGMWLAITGSAAVSWRWAMLGQCIPVALGLLLAFAMKDPPRDVATVARPSLREVYEQLWRYRAMLLPLLLAFALVAGIADGAAVIWAAPALSRSYALSPERAAALMGTVLLINGLVAPLLGGLIADWGQRMGGPQRTAALLAVLLVLAIPTGLFAFAPVATAAVALLALFLVLGTAFQVGAFALATIVIPAHLRASCLSMMLAIALLFAYGLAPLVVSHLSVALGGPTLIGKSLALVCSASSALGALAFLAGLRQFRRGTV